MHMLRTAFLLWLPLSTVLAQGDSAKDAEKPAESKPSATVAAPKFKKGDLVVCIADTAIREDGVQVEAVKAGQVFTVRTVEGDRMRVNSDHAGSLESRKMILADRQAIEQITQLIRLQPGVAQLFRGRAFCWLTVGEVDIALADFNEALRLAPKHPLTLVNRGKTWSRKGNLELALADYNEAIRQNSAISDAYLARGITWTRKGELDKAISDFSEVIQLDRASGNRLFSGDAFRCRGILWRAKEEYAKSIQDFDEALRLDAQDVGAYIERAETWRKMGKTDKAIADLNEALRLEPGKGLTYAQRGDLWLKKEDMDKALADYNEAVRQGYRDGILYSHRGLIWRRKEEYQKAIADFSEAIRLEPDLATPYRNLAELLATCADARIRSGKKAVEYGEKAWELSERKSALAAFVLAAAYAENGNFAKAVELQTKVVAMAPPSVKASHEKRLKLYQSGKPFHEEP